MSTYTRLIYHLVYSTKFRRPFIQPDVQERLYDYLGGIVRQQRGLLLEIGGMADHVHLLTRLSPSLALSDVLRVIKSNSSKWFNETFSRRLPFAWQSGFAAFSVSASAVDDVRRYILGQEEHHRRQSFRDEYRALLRKHGIDFDEQHLFDVEFIV